MALGGMHTSLAGLLAGADLSSSQYKIVKFASTAGEVIVGALATDNLIGVLMNDPADGEAADIAVLGIAKVQCEASQNAGAWVTSSTTGRAKVTSTGNDDVIGKLLEASSDAGDIAAILLTGPSNF
jgi:hypothetical protein